jgi:hypothetical protein
VSIDSLTQPTLGLPHVACASRGRSQDLVVEISLELDVQLTGDPHDAKNPEGVLTEAITLSGLSTLLALQPRRAGLPARPQSHLSVTSSPIWSYLQVGSATIGRPFRGGQLQRLIEFRELAEFFATAVRGIPATTSNLPAMADQDTIRELGRLLGAAARDHHEEHGGGPAPTWADWYAGWLVGKIDPYVGFEPSLDQVKEWLQEADERFRTEDPDTKWPYFYAELIIESLAPAAR